MPAKRRTASMVAAAIDGCGNVSTNPTMGSVIVLVPDTTPLLPCIGIVRCHRLLHSSVTLKALSFVSPQAAWRASLACPSLLSVCLSVCHCQWQRVHSRDLTAFFFCYRQRFTPFLCCFGINMSETCSSSKQPVFRSQTASNNIILTVHSRRVPQTGTHSHIIGYWSL